MFHFLKLLIFALFGLFVVIFSIMAMAGMPMTGAIYGLIVFIAVLFAGVAQAIHWANGH